MTDAQRTWTVERLRDADPHRAEALEAAFTVADTLGLWRAPCLPLLPELATVEVEPYV